MEKNTDVKTKASLSLDLDNMWSYLKTHGDEAWVSFPSYLDVVVPRILDVLKQQNLKITIFVVGQDAQIQKNHKIIRSIHEAGHEIGNHSFNHEPWLPDHPEREIESEIAQTEELIKEITGQKPIGFRGPGYCLSMQILKILARRGYLYDASTLPTFLGPFARLYYFMTSNLRPEEKENRKELFGGFRDGLRPIHSYRIKTGAMDENMVEVPVTTMPFFRMPFHVSYILYIYRFSPFLARLYFRLALKLCQVARVQPSLLLHPLDFLGCEDSDQLAFFPAMDLRSEVKIKMVGELLGIYANHFTILPLGEYVNSIMQADYIRTIKPYFPIKNPAETSKALSHD